LKRGVVVVGIRQTTLSKNARKETRSVAYSPKNFFFSNKFASNLGEKKILEENFKMLTRDVEEKLFLKNLIRNLRENLRLRSTLRSTYTFVIVHPNP
jgi:hypothetical protein